MTRVWVYRNLAKNCLSVKRGKARVEHSVRVLLKDVVFRVRPAGREKVRREGRKGVHAFVTGTPVTPAEKTPNRGWEPFTYDPYRHDTFVLSNTGEPLLTARFASLEITPAGKVRCLVNR